ncbi:hypothetical protein GCM10017655_28330 [Pseudomonas turukhanskensis]|uniref:Uncharacterized protein n=1 Tax=Pseudomonas turukhanskensis TaxID=1806536 RepID=A0A9W6NGJ3_9PSED|nr:hypothetical protein GCM10017655_28330 [Pseudomonas turukhanskensis]
MFLVVREGGDWQFLCGGMDHNDPNELYHVSIGALIDADLTLHQISDLSAEREAERTEIDGEWIRTLGIQ